jgi:hypothetical protein
VPVPLQAEPDGKSLLFILSVTSASAAESVSSAAVMVNIKVLIECLPILFLISPQRIKEKDEEIVKAVRCGISSLLDPRMGGFFYL